jgi:glycolate oxidase iron-sulfur subunit
MAKPEAPRLSPAAVKELDTCVHCGLCLPFCPTYRELGMEADSPRGRLHLMKALHEGRTGVTAELVEHLYLCLDCRACESACPSGVVYSLPLEEARARIEGHFPRAGWVSWLRRRLLRGLLPHPGRLRLVARLLRLVQRLRLDRLAFLMPGRLARLAPMAPPVPPRSSRELLPEQLVGGPLRIGLVVGCIQDVLLPETNLATARLLQRAGATVVTPAQQVCCGALHQHAGDAEAARELARQNIVAFEAAGVDYVCINAAGCGAQLKHYGDLLRDDPAWAGRAERFAAAVRDFTELAAELGAPVRRQEPRQTTWQDPCHLAHGQRIRQQPRELVRAAAPAYVEMQGADQCCGSAGFYSLTEHEMSMAILDRKMEAVRATGAQVLVTANAGCLLQLRYGARRAGLTVEVVHLADWLDSLQESRGDAGAEQAEADGSFAESAERGRRAWLSGRLR